MERLIGESGAVKHWYHSAVNQTQIHTQCGCYHCLMLHWSVYCSLSV